MVFTDLIFLFCFLPISVLLTKLIRNTKLQNILLVLLSLLFYAWSNPIYVVLLILSILWNYFTAFELEAQDDEKTKKILLIVSVVVNLFILGFYKYTGFLMDILHIQSNLKIALPVGLSFFTFSELSYIFDVYNGKSKPQKNIILFTLYVSFFGKISMGPIVSYHEMEDQLTNRTLSKAQYASGMVLFSKGLIKKVLLADQLSYVYSILQNNTSTLGVWLLAISTCYKSILTSPAIQTWPLDSQDSLALTSNQTSTTHTQPHLYKTSGENGTSLYPNGLETTYIFH